jgi:hypothetical protein
MPDLVIHLTPSSVNDTCAICGGPIPPDAGPQLLRADNLDVVCRPCGKEHAPSLVALLDLAGVAERVARIGRHTVFPPLTTLLDLARAAEDYTLADSRGGRRAA